jgi:hypothetical protein
MRYKTLRYELGLCSSLPYVFWPSFSIATSIFGQVFDWVILLLLCCDLLFILVTSSLLDIWLPNTCHILWGCLFCLIVSIGEQMFKFWCHSTCLFTPLVACAFGVILKKLLLNPWSQRFTPIVYSVFFKFQLVTYLDLWLNAWIWCGVCV